jgi:hypothetical protein
VKKMKNNTILAIILGIVIAAVAFFGGIKYQELKAAATSTGGNRVAGALQGKNGQNGRFARGGTFGGATTGEIVSADANSITVKLSDGSSKIVNLSDKTTYTKSDTASKADLKTGEKVAAFGTSNSDGSITATDVQLNPQMFVRKGVKPQPTK